MRIRVETIIPAAPDDVWAVLLTPALLRHVAFPLIIFDAAEPLPGEWSEGDYQVSMRLFGLVPLGRQRIRIRLLETESWPRHVRDEGSGSLAKVWRHDIFLRPDGNGATAYHDEVEVRAGLLTPVVWLFAHLFYRWRQHRWRALAQHGLKHAH